MLLKISFRYRCLKKVNITNVSILYFLLVITPLMDTINGWYVLNHGETGISIGTFYRLILLLYIFLYFRFNKNEMMWLLITTYFPISSAIRAVLGGYSFISAFTYGLKWMLPVIFILLFNHLKDSGKTNFPIRILDIWKYLIPTILIIEYILRIGEKSYFDAGFKGLFYCTNDIGFSLTMMSIYSIYSFFFVSMNVKNVIPLILNIAAILILSTKSCLIFTVITLLLCLLKKLKKASRKFVFMFLIMLLIFFGVIYRMQENIHGIIERYSMFYSQTVGTGRTFSNIMGFLTSARTYRMPGALDDLSVNFNLFKVLFGWCKPIFTGAIEMDWLDLVFQHGIVGIAILFLFYIKIIMKRGYKPPFRYMIIIAMICAMFSGHVLNGALPSTVFSIVVGCSLFSIKSNMVRF